MRKVGSVGVGGGVMWLLRKWKKRFSRVGSRSESRGCRIDCFSSRTQSSRQRALDSHARIFITILNISIFRCPKLLIAEAFLLKTNRSGLCVSDNKTNEVRRGETKKSSDSQTLCVCQTYVVLFYKHQTTRH